MSNIADNLSKIHTQIQTASKHTTQPVMLLAVSKTKPISDIQLAYQAGQRCFGENYVQEGVDKINQLTSLVDIQWYFIGPLQSNKTRLVAEHFDWVLSIDRLKIAQRLNEQRPVHKKKLNVCLQINISQESTKSGVQAEEINQLAAQVAKMPNLSLRGLMAIPAKSDNINELADSFKAMNLLYQQLKSQYKTIDTLSMGMSNDMQIAIENGSTMVRIGTAIFGTRQTT